MPVYNGAPFLREAIESVLNQSRAEFEFLIVDDGSTDEAPSIIASYAARDSRIKVLRQENRGPGAAMNAGLKACSGDWVFVMHGDDIMLPNRLERQVAFIRNNPQLALVGAYVFLISPKGKIIGEGRAAYIDVRMVQEVKNKGGIIGGLYHVAFSRSIGLSIGGFREDMTVNEDVDFYNRLLDAGHLLLIQPEFLMKYRVHASSASVAKVLMIRKHWRYIKDEIFRRRAGLESRLFEAFIEAERKRPFFVRLNTQRKDLAKFFYKQATLNFSFEHHLATILFGALTFMLQPVFFWSQIFHKRPFTTRNGAHPQ